MTEESSRASERDARDLARDARRERLLIPQGLLALALVVALVVVRELLLR
jgi:hypothetical protein